MINSGDHKQLLLFDPWSNLGEKRRKLLEDFWAGTFQKEILPDLPVEILFPYFNTSFGRPTKDLYTVIGVEATMSQYDRLTGVKRLRVRGLKAVRYCAVMKAVALNIFRAASLTIALNRAIKGNFGADRLIKSIIAIFNELFCFFEPYFCCEKFAVNEFASLLSF